MQSAETVLDVLRERGRRGLPLDELYRQLFNPQLYLRRYCCFRGSRHRCGQGESRIVVLSRSFRGLGIPALVLFPGVR
jgi:hypothetical protein